MPTEKAFISHFYVVEDLTAKGPLAIEEYPTLVDAMACYLDLPNDRRKALGIVNTQSPPGSLDLVQCIDGKSCLTKDYERVPNWKRREVWAVVHELTENYNISDILEIRFIDAEYNDLFRLPHGSNIILTYEDGTEKVMNCGYVDHTHVRIGQGNIFHICQFAEMCMKNGWVVRPEHLRPGEMVGTYEVYQIADIGAADYAFAEYDRAAAQLNAADYKKVYAGMLSEKIPLDRLYYLHNIDERPCSRSMRSMSVSDIIITHLHDKHTAWYVDSTRFRELPGMAEKLAKMQARQLGAKPLYVEDR